MILYIHFGIYKAGSSYLQYICANQRDYLLSKGIYFPKSKEDAKMQAGEISRGNADGLELAMISEKSAKITAILKQWYKQAQESNAKAVLISAEALVHQLALTNQLNQLVSCAHSVEFTEIKAMGFFRNLADHALSTYKHRAKSGRIPDYSHWVYKVYETPKLFQNLSHVVSENKNIKWTLRKFQKDSDFLKQAFFKDWLGVDIPDFQTRPSVNESVTLSEVKLLTHLKKVHPFVLDFFVEDLKELSKNAKAKDYALENYIFNRFATHLSHHKELLKDFNVFFPEGEKLIVGVQKNDQTTEPFLQLSDVQLQTITNRMAFFHTWKGQMIILRRRVLRLIKN